jgi:uncharacterized protein YukE
MVDLIDVPRLPTWDAQAADDLRREAEAARRQLGELWPRLEAAHRRALGAWTGRSFVSFEERFGEIERLAARLRAELEAVPARVAGGADAADHQRRRWVLYQASPAAGVVHDVLDWLGG